MRAMLVRCFHPLALSPIYSVDLTSASAQVSQTRLQDSSLMCSLQANILHFFLFCDCEKGSLFSDQSPAKTSGSVRQDGDRWWRLS